MVPPAGNQVFRHFTFRSQHMASHFAEDIYETNIEVELTKYDFNLTIANMLKRNQV